MSKKNKFIVAGVSYPQKRLSSAGKAYDHPDTFVITLSPTLDEAKEFIESGKVPDSDTLQYVVIEEMKELSVKTKIQRWFICKDGEINMLADPPVNYKSVSSMISM